VIQLTINKLELAKSILKDQGYNIETPDYELRERIKETKSTINWMLTHMKNWSLRDLLEVLEKPHIN